MTSWRSTDRRVAWRTFFETSLRLETRLDEDLRASTGLGMIDYHLLLLLTEAPGCRMRMGELAEQMVFSSSRLTYQVKVMEQRGWVLRQTSSEDKRVSYAVLTATGIDAFREASGHHVRTVQTLFTDGLDAEELHTLTRVFDRLRQRLDDSTVEDHGAPQSSEAASDDDGPASGEKLAGTG